VQLAEQGEQAEVDPLQDHVGARDPGVRGQRAAEVEELPGHRGGVLAGHGHRATLPDGVVEHRHVLHDQRRGHRRVRDQEAGLHHGPAERLGVGIHAQVLDHRGQRLHLLGREVLDQAEVQEGDPPAAVEQVVARVRIAVEGVRLVQAAEHEAVDSLRGQVPLGLRPAGQLGEPGPVGELAGHHPAGGQLGHDLRHGDGGVARVVVGERLLVTGFAAVVEFLGDPLAQLREQRVDVLARRGDLQHPAQQPDVPQVGFDGLGDARVLDFDRDGAAVVGDRPVHLPDRGGRDRLGIPGRERPLRRQAKLFGDHLRGQFGAHRRHAVLQSAQRAAGRRRQAVVDVAGHLAELHQHALHRAQGRGDVFGRLQGQVIAQLLPVLTRTGEQPWRVARVPRAAPRGQPQRRHPALHPQAAAPSAVPSQHRQRRDRHPAHRRGGGQLPAPDPQPRAALIRRVSCCRASSTPGSAMNTASNTPSVWRIPVRRAASSGGGTG
jgi:hypothetical protein